MKRALAAAAVVAAVCIVIATRGERAPAAAAPPVARLAPVHTTAAVARDTAAPEVFKQLSAAVLNHALRTPPDAGALLHALVEERSPETALQLARTLAQYESDDDLRAETIAALRATPEARRVGLLALMGRADPDALQLAADTFAAHGDPETGATAAFVLHTAPSDALPENAYAAARQALREHWENAHLREEAASLLGRADATPEDVSLLEQATMNDTPSVRMRALAALDYAADPRLGEMCDTILRDTSAPDRLQQMAKAWRAMHQG